MAKRKIIFPIIQKLKEFYPQIKEMIQDRNFLWLKLKGKQMYGYDFHRQNRLIIF
jgi:hypothetical protein